MRAIGSMFSHFAIVIAYMATYLAERHRYKLDSIALLLKHNLLFSMNITLRIMKI